MSSVFHSDSNSNIFSNHPYKEEKLFFTNNHRYYTRSTAKKFKDPLPIVHSFQPNWKREQDDILETKYCIKSKLRSNVSNSSVNIGINTDEIKMRSNPCEPCEPPSCSNNKKILFKSIQLVLFLGLLSLLICHMIERFGETNTSFKYIKEELDDIKISLGSLNEIQSNLKTMDSKIDDNHNELKTEISTLKSLIENNTEKHLDELRAIVAESLETYDADKTGQTDFALESAGGSIVSIRDTVTYMSGANTLSVFGIPLCSSSHNARIIIQPSRLPGECWAIAGSTGAVVIQLLGRVIVTGVSLEHIPVSISPTGEITTAPKDFGVFGLSKADDANGPLIGRYMYNISGPPVQYFPSDNKDSFPLVELKIFSNHGHPDYTCIYRLRVHGQLESSIR